ncbi:hypothetical protein FRC10_007661 [Ceratobasidium sp. 414]|nr:hypothetical protein FRC10_007661 [Ceratobasidium sp. 414]
MSSLTAARYGKDKVRVFRIVRDGDKHTVVEYIVRALLEGDIATSYTQADNSVVVATDSIIAKTSPHVLSPELYALHLGAHFVTKYPHIHKAFIDVEQLKWTRIDVEGTPHKHSFVRDGEEKIVVKAEIDATAGKDKVSATIEAGIKDLLAAVGEKAKFGELQRSVRKITLETFATDESASVQATMFKMSQKFIAENGTASAISYRLPNKHYIPVPLDFIGLANSKPKDAEVFCPVDAPSGYITATVSRE